MANAIDFVLAVCSFLALSRDLHLMQACSAHTVLLARDCPPVATVDRNHGNGTRPWGNMDQDGAKVSHRCLSIAWPGTSVIKTQKGLHNYNTSKGIRT